MWQRIQTVFLLIVILSLGASIFLPIWMMNESQTQHVLFPLYYGTHEATQSGAGLSESYIPYCITAILFIAAITIAVIEITKFKDRLLQIKLGTLNSLLLAGGLGSAVYFATSLVKTHDGGQYGLGLWLPGIAVIANWLAMRFIRRDEKLVRDSNRLR
jgi:hypothetical protein